MGKKNPLGTTPIQIFQGEGNPNGETPKEVGKNPKGEIKEEYGPKVTPTNI